MRRGKTRCFLGGLAFLSGFLAIVLADVVDAAVTRAGLRIEKSAVTGLASFVTAEGRPIPVALPAGQVKPTADDFLAEFGRLFGVQDPVAQLRRAQTAVDPIGFAHTTYQQMHNGVKVFSGVLKVHQSGTGDVLAANGEFYPIPFALGVVPAIQQDEAVKIARVAAKSTDAAVELVELVVVDPGWYGDPPIGARLAYYVALNDMLSMREAFFVDAQAGVILDRWSLIHNIRFRRVHNGMGGSALPGVLARQEGQPPVASPVDVNRAYDYAGDVYDYFFRAFNRDGINGAGEWLILTVNSVPVEVACPNAFWNGTQMVFCSGTVTDDITAHEITHGLTERTANLIYQNQSGQLNESFSDVFGELVDLFNGNAAFPGPPGGSPSWPAHPTGPGLDAPNNLRTSCSNEPGYANGVRWMVSEDATAFGGAIRDMWSPTCEDDFGPLPDQADSPYQLCQSFDFGGVHLGSSIPNHAFAMLTDGKVFNGYTVIGIGPIKSGAVWYRALTVYLTPASDFVDAYAAFNQAAQDLVGTFPNDPRTGAASASMFTAADAVEVDKALKAVELNTEGSCGSKMRVLLADQAPICPSATTVYSATFEGGASGWTVSHGGPYGPPTAYDWVLSSSLLPYERPGTVWHARDLTTGDCVRRDESAVHSLQSPAIQLPGGATGLKLVFTHFVSTETRWDGGNVRIRVNSGAWTLIPRPAFDYNPYNASIVAAGNTNSLAGQDAWVGRGDGWGTSIVNLDGLASGGDTIELRFDFGKDGCVGAGGWWVDDVRVLDCP